MPILAVARHTKREVPPESEDCICEAGRKHWVVGPNVNVEVLCDKIELAVQSLSERPDQDMKDMFGYS